MPAGDLVAEVRAPGQGRGSGFLIAPGIVLTALHVVLGDDPEAIPPDHRSEIRLRRDVDAFDRSFGYDYRRSRFSAHLARDDDRLNWRSAKLIYPLPGQNPLPDVALLEIEGEIAAFPGPDERPMAEPIGPRECRAAGFPAFKSTTIDGKNVWNSYDLRGAAGARRTRSGSVEIEVRTDTPADSADWKGMSGAAVWRDEEGDNDEDDRPTFRRVLGVVDARQERVHGNRIISFWPLADLPPQDPFWALARIDRAAARRTTSMTIGEAIAQLDRVDAANGFRAWLAGDRAGVPPRWQRSGPPARTSVVVVRAHAVDEVALYAARLANILAGEAYKANADNYRRPILLDSGDQEDHPADRLFSLQREWASRYASNPPSIGDDLEAIIADGLVAPDRTRLIVVEHRSPSFGKNCIETLDGLLALVARVSAGGANAPPVVVLCFQTGENAGKEGEAFLPRTVFPGKEAAIEAYVAQLATAHPAFDWNDQRRPLGRPEIDAQDVEDWLDELRRLGTYRLPADLQNRLRIAVGVHPEFPMRFARVALNRVLAG